MGRTATHRKDGQWSRPIPFYAAADVCKAYPSVGRPDQQSLHQALRRCGSHQLRLPCPPSRPVGSRHARALRRLGQGWVGEEALAIALCCGLRVYSLEEGLCLAVKLTGDCDSTACGATPDRPCGDPRPRAAATPRPPRAAHAARRIALNRQSPGQQTRHRTGPLQQPTDRGAKRTRVRPGSCRAGPRPFVPGRRQAGCPATRPIPPRPSEQRRQRRGSKADLDRIARRIAGKIHRAGLPLPGLQSEAIRQLRVTAKPIERVSDQ